MGNILFGISQTFGNHLADVGVFNISVNAGGGSGLGGSCFLGSGRGLFHRSGSVLGSFDSFIHISVQDSSVRSSSRNRVDSNTGGISGDSGDRRSENSLSSGSNDSSNSAGSLSRGRGRCGLNNGGSNRSSFSLRTPVGKGSNIFLVLYQNG